MSDFLTQVLTADAPVPREVAFGQQVGTVHFKRVTAGQRALLLKGQRVQTKVGEGATVDIDLGENESTKLQMVQFCVCHEDGKPFFKNVADVQRLEASKVNVLYRHVQEVNSEADEPGKS